MSLEGVLRATEDYCGGLISTGSPNVFINGKPVVRIGDQVAYYGPGSESSAVMATGSSTFFVNGKPVCRVGDLNTAGTPATGGAPFNVYSG
jgi:uncharacterized Zn-binding protein involved in type VI secretion